MKHLFVIGNGFDAYVHELPTKYADFRKYLLNRYPGAAEYNDLVPSSVMLPDGGDRIDFEAVAGYIVRILDQCDYEGDDRWTDLEYYLGTSIYDWFYEDLDIIGRGDIDEKEMRHAYYNNEDISSDIEETFGCLKELLCDWIDDKLSRINFASIKRDDVASVLEDGDGFLIFNYTRTPETVYGIKGTICHIHGMAGDNRGDIVFGHGDDEDIPERFETFGSETNINRLKRKLRKNTQKALQKNMDFFRDMKDVETIHSCGFSFAEVDMIYIKEIAKHVDLNKAVWYLNNYDSTNEPQKREKLEAEGFCVQVDGRW